jgi:replicative DNA helicase
MATEIHRFALDQRVPPHDIEAEQQLLGAILANNDSYAKVVDLISAKTFFDPIHQRIWSVIETKIDAGHLASAVTLKPAFENDEGMKELGGVRYLARLVGVSIASFAVRDYATIIADMAAKRVLIEHIQKADNDLSKGELSASEIAVSLENSAGAVASTSSIKPMTQSYISTVIKSVSDINATYMGEKPAGLSTGIRQLDQKLSGGFRPGEFIVLAGRPSMGKTSVAQNIAFNVAQQGRAVFFASLEMLAPALVNRFLSLGLAQKGNKIPYTKLTSGDLTESQMRQIVEEAQAQQELPIEFAEREQREVRQLKSAARRAKQKFADTKTPLGLIVIDYLQLIDVLAAKSIYERVSTASDVCKSIANEFELPVVALSQLSRNVEMRDPPMPQLSDLRESGRLEEDADVVMMTYRDEYYTEKRLESAIASGNRDEEIDLRTVLDRQRGKLDIFIPKQRGGATGMVSAWSNMACCHVYADRSQEEGQLL